MLRALRANGGVDRSAHFRGSPANSPRNSLASSLWSSPDPSAAILREFALDFAHEFAIEFAGDFSLGFARDYALESARYFACDFARDFALEFARDFALEFTDSEAVPDLSPRMSLRAGTSEEETLRAVGNLVAALAGEAVIALATMAKSESDDERCGYFLFRIQNRWLFEVWTGIDQWLPAPPSPAQLALYFALGWAQSTTTWAWPDSERWRTLFAAGPGEHWLVRSQWHLCKLTDDPASKYDDAGLRSALRDGHHDESLPGYAARLSEVLGI